MKNYYREQRHKILAAIHSSPLAAVSQITERNAGTHFVLHINTKLTEAEVRKAARGEQICAFPSIPITVIIPKKITAARLLSITLPSRQIKLPQ